MHQAVSWEKAIDLSSHLPELTFCERFQWLQIDNTNFKVDGHINKHPIAFFVGFRVIFV